MKNAKSKKGFTLIEIIVVLAILAIVAAIAVPTAFGSLEKAKDAAAIASLESMGSVVRTARILSLADDKFRESMSAAVSGAFFEYINGAFRILSTGGHNEYEKYMLEALNASKLRVDKKAYFYMRIDEGGQDSLFGYLLMYAPNGAETSGVPNPKYKYPYYRYLSSDGTVLKYKSDGSSEIINKK